MVTAMAASCAAHMVPASSAGVSATRSAASRFVRFDTGSSRLAVLASHTVVMASGTAVMPTRDASDNITGVSNTAVVSRLRVIVVIEANATHSTNRRGYVPR